jgi:hypothetical protein
VGFNTLFRGAVPAKVDVLLTADRDFIKYAKKINTFLRVENPVNWFMGVIGLVQEPGWFSHKSRGFSG